MGKIRAILILGFLVGGVCLKAQTSPAININPATLLAVYSAPTGGNQIYGTVASSTFNISFTAGPPLPGGCTQTCNLCSHL